MNRRLMLVVLFVATLVAILAWKNWGAGEVLVVSRCESAVSPPGRAVAEVHQCPSQIVLFKE